MATFVLQRYRNDWSFQHFPSHFSHRRWSAIGVSRRLSRFIVQQFMPEGSLHLVGDDSLHAAQTHLNEAAVDAKFTEVVADKGYHSTDLLETLAQRTQFRSFIAEPKSPTGERNWKGVSKLKRKAAEANRRRLKAAKGKKLQRARSEKVERTFAHVLETGGARRTWLRGFDKVRKRHSIATAAYNLGVLMRTLFGIGTARGLQAFNGGLQGLLAFIYLAWIATKRFRSQQSEGRSILTRPSRFQFA